MRAYSNDLREKVIKALQQGQKARDVAVRFDVCISWVYKIRKRFIDTGSYEALPRPGAPRKFSDDDINKLYELVKNNPSATLDELRTMGNFHVGRTTIHRVLRNKLKITYKKSTLRHRTEQKRCSTETNRTGSKG